MRAYEDFNVGMVLTSGPYEVTLEDIREFAEEFDPQPLHLDEEAARNGLYGKIIASGWHTCSIFMRMMCDSFLHNTLSQGAPGIDQVRWKKPVFPGDVLTGKTKVASKSRSRTKPQLGFIKFQNEIYNQHGDLVMTINNPAMVTVRHPQIGEDR